MSGRGDTQPVFIKAQDHLLSSHQSSSVSHCELTQSASSIRSSLNVSAEASLQIKIFSGSAAGSFLDENSSSESELVIVYFKDDIRLIEDLNEETAPVNPALVNLKDDAATIYEKWGTHYISSIVYGASLQVTFRIKSTDKSSLMKIKGSLSGSINLAAFKLSVKAEGLMEEATVTSTKTISYEIFQRGGNKVSMDAAPTSMDAVFDLISNFQPDAGPNPTLKVVGYRVKPIPIHRIEALNISEYEFVVMKSKIKRAAEMLGELLLLQGRANHLRTDFQSRAGNIFFEAVIRPKLIGAANKVILGAEDAIINISKFLAQTPREIVGTSIVDWDYDKESALRADVDGLAGVGTKAFDIDNETILGYFKGYVIDGDVCYKGEFTPALPAAKTSYVGEWFMNKRHDYNKAIMVYPNGDKYEGTFYEDMREGEGTLTTKEGTYTGHWHQDQKSGKGTLSRLKARADSSSSDLQYEELYSGEWEMDAPKKEALAPAPTPTPPKK